VTSRLGRETREPFFYGVHSDNIIFMCGIQFWKDNGNLRSVSKIVFRNIVQFPSIFELLKFSKRLILPSQR
jgi:hypothetical protein